MCIRDRFYALAATLGGSVFGVFAGEKILPFIIINAYGIMYHHMPDIVIPYNMQFAVLATGAALVCTLGATVVACYHELAATPAILMRPPAPKQGKRVPVSYTHLDVYKRQLLVLIIIILSNRERAAYIEFLHPLTEACDPDFTLLAHSYIYCYRWGLRAYVPYSYSINLAEAMRCAGDFQEALKFSEMIWHGTRYSRFREKRLVYLYYHHLRYECYCMLKDEEGKRAERQQIEDFIGRNGKKKSKKKSKKMQSMICYVRYSLCINRCV